MAFIIAANKHKMKEKEQKNNPINIKKSMIVQIMPIQCIINNKVIGFSNNNNFFNSYRKHFNKIFKLSSKFFQRV